MSQVLTLSDSLHAKLATAARQQGYASIEEMLAAWRFDERAGDHRQEAVARVNAIRDKLFQEHGEMPDSTPLIRADRER